jgi:hypothetical protein
MQIALVPSSYQLDVGRLSFLLETPAPEAQGKHLPFYERDVNSLRELMLNSLPEMGGLGITKLGQDTPVFSMIANTQMNPVAKYRKMERIGSGTSGVVYKKKLSAFQWTGSRACELKEWRSSLCIIGRFAGKPLHRRKASSSHLIAASYLCGS